MDRLPQESWFQTPMIIFFLLFDYDWKLQLIESLSYDSMKVLVQTHRPSLFFSDFVYIEVINW